MARLGLVVALALGFASAQPKPGGQPSGPPPQPGGQPSGGGSGGASCATDGSSATYAETLGDDSKMNLVRTIVTSTCPNHESMCTGKPVTGCGDIGENGDSTSPAFLNLYLSRPCRACTGKD